MAQPALRHLLIVEDDPDQCRALRDRLELYGYAVSCAEDGHAAIELLRERSFDGVLLDLNLPTISGDQILALTREMLPDLPVLILSAFHTRIRATKKTHGGACGYISKPFGIAELKQALQSCFGPARQPVAS